MMKHTLIFPALLVFGLACCKRDEEIKVYRVEKESPAATAQGGDPHAGVPGMAPGAMPDDPHAGIPGLGNAAAPSGDPHAGLDIGGMAPVGSRPKLGVEDAAPADWKRREPSAMRQLSYQLDGEEGVSADISLIILRGAAGRDLDNINRWREEQGLEAMDQDTLAKNAESFTTPAGSAVAVDIEGLPAGADPKTDGRLLGAIVTRGDDGWFFRMRGNAELTAAHKEAFISWVKSVKPGSETAEITPEAAADKTPVESDGAEPPCCPTDGKHGEHADHASSSATPAPAGDGRLVWQAPAGWVLDPTAGSMRFATFRINHPDGSKGEMAITHFPGDVGGDLENVNRWRNQIGLPPVAAADLADLVTKITAGPKTLSLVDFSHDGQRLAAGWTRHDADTWFFKFSGPAAVVGAEMEKFNALLESIRFGSPAQ